MALYNASARALKAVDPSLQVGGPATASLAHVADFVSECEARDIPYDFVSTHHYPTDSCPKGPAWDPDCFINGVLETRATVAPTVPFFLTEYNVGCCLGYVGHDVSTAAAFVFRAVGALNEHLDLYSYWTFTDVFEEGGLPRIEYKNVYGAMSVSGVPKPVWRAFELLHAHAGNGRLPVAISNQTAAPELQSADEKTLWAVAVPCNASDTTQLGWSNAGSALQWADPAHDAKPLCIDTLSGTAALQLTPCSYLQPSQMFERDGSSYKQSGRCLDVFQADPPTYRRVDLYACNGGDNQQFDLTSATALMAHSHACVAARTTHAGPPPPPPPPPSAPKAFISGFATVDSTSLAGLDNLRAFLSFWADPEATAAELPANRTVKVYVTHDADTPHYTHASVYSVDDITTHAAASWVAMGSPAQPNASELALLMAASQIHTRPVVDLTPLNESCFFLEVSMRPNSVAVVAFV